MMETVILPLVLGIIEGLTEFLPVSSTGHLLLAGHFLGFESEGRTFEVVIQLGAVLAVLSVYAAKIWQVFSTAPSSAESRRFILAVLLAFLPAVFVGVLARDFIKGVLFESPRLIASMLILGGIVLLFVDRLALKPRFDRVEDIPVWRAVMIGCIQCLAMVPGVSRSGATIVGALALGASKRAAAEFSFFLAMPTMAGAFAYDLYKSWDSLSTDAVTQIGIGFVAAFISAVFVVKGLLGYVSRHGYALFGWWRIAVGVLVLGVLGIA
ncbi:MAG TPA: undecaprenyl-diphosphatase [Rhodobacteraceae bacterium]|jgi:undecaprenyl-diphosphatase|nr:undecaprenyl-diphosphatase [Paracoccaceae bacterium]